MYTQYISVYDAASLLHVQLTSCHVHSGGDPKCRLRWRFGSERIYSDGEKGKEMVCGGNGEVKAEDGIDGGGTRCGLSGEGCWRAGRQVSDWSR